MMGISNRSVRRIVVFQPNGRQGSKTAAVYCIWSKKLYVGNAEKTQQATPVGQEPY